MNFLKFSLINKNKQNIKKFYKKIIRILEKFKQIFFESKIFKIFQKL